MFEPEKGKLSFMQILIAGACASGGVSLLGLQGATRLIAMVVAFVAVGGVMLVISNGKKDEPVKRDTDDLIRPDRDPMD